ncbi:methyltransferase, TIGR04325 family [Variovorax sp. J22P271]|uniref:methyltransferase, TIGR04325 family n=1 Tax=Variovorax davisae TaxID=3053515 RepID=UPI002576650F|nr:methyltransferase, TIGR04325 family [Variovorax sp. J22P271]MDM0031919.1 methyltransferase, TIGR04325 family [Variovorax sp. J22P271]
MAQNLLPLPRAFREAAYRRKFIDNVDEHLFMGSYESFEAAAAAAPKSKPMGFDNAEEARRLFSQKIFFYDYPALFWIARSFEDGLRSVFDLGGHAGIKYYAFRRVLNYPSGLRWKTCDVAGVIQAGREIAAERGIGEELSFTSDYQEATGFDVLFISGCLQFLPERMPQILAALPVKPKRIILNTTTVHPERTIFTVHSLGFGFCPYRIQKHDELMAELVEAGYVRRDAWRNEGKLIEVPFVEGGDAAYYAGCCFDLRPA